VQCSTVKIGRTAVVQIRVSSPRPQQPIATNTEHRLVHLQQQMHLASSTVGALNPFWVIAPTGHCLMTGHG
jgi:hypothetical protein